MGEMREWWANVYDWDGVAEIVFRSPTRQGSVEGFIGSSRASCRIHVRLKPEGAPRRYASAWNRNAWEQAPHICRRLVAEGIAPERVD